MSVSIGYVTGNLDLTNYRYPTTATMAKSSDGYSNSSSGDTIYGYANKPCVIVANNSHYSLSAGMYFCIPAPMQIMPSRHGDENVALIIVRHNYRGIFSLGGPIEDKGRLRYIDSCSDTLLISPPRLGDPCLNFLHFPKNISQTMHTHPSVRIGVIARGSGICKTPDGSFELSPGMLWLLPENAPHAFFTQDSTMDVIAWHPDSDTGPSDDDHPMINRTIVNGVSANQIDSIRTTGNIRGD